jgi:hypothetical protein
MNQGVDDFLKNADESDEVPDVERGTKTYEDFKLLPEEWDLCMLIKEVLVVDDEHLSIHTRY